MPHSCFSPFYFVSHSFHSCTLIKSASLMPRSFSPCFWLVPLLYLSQSSPLLTYCSLLVHHPFSSNVFFSRTWLISQSCLSGAPLVTRSLLTCIPFVSNSCLAFSSLIPHSCIPRSTSHVFRSFLTRKSLATNHKRRPALNELANFNK